MQNTEEYKRVAPGIDIGTKKRYSEEFREQVAQLVAQGLKNGEIAQRMGVKTQAIADLKRSINWRVKEILGLEIDGSPKVRKVHNESIDSHVEGAAVCDDRGGVDDAGRAEPAACAVAEEPAAPQTVIFEENGKEYSVEVKPEVHDLKELSGALSRNELRRMNAAIDATAELFDGISLDMKCTTAWNTLLIGLRELRAKRFDDLVDWDRIAEGK